MAELLKRVEQEGKYGSVPTVHYEAVGYTEEDVRAKDAAIAELVAVLASLDPWPDEEINPSSGDGTCYCEITHGEARAIRALLAKHKVSND